MSTHPTFPKPAYAAQSLGDQRKGLLALAAVAEQHPDLPSGVLYVSHVYPRRVEVQLHSHAEVEAWREALDVAPEQVTGDQRGHDITVEFAASRDGVEFHVWAAQIVVSLAVSA